MSSTNQIIHKLDQDDDYLIRINFPNSRRDDEMHEILYEYYAQRVGARKLIRAKIFSYNFFDFFFFNEISPFYFSPTDT